jgi:tetratricopeptide (TPR) repeat protein
LAQELLAGGDKKGLRLMKGMVKENPKLIQPYMLIGDFYRKNGDYRRAIRWYTRGIKANDTSPMLPEVRLSRAIVYELSGKDALALADLEEASKTSQLPELMNYYGYFLINRGMDLDKGMRFIQMALAAEPSNPYYIDSYGWAHYKKGDYEEAVRLLEYAYALAPSNAIINSHLGDAYWAAGRRRDAKFAWGKALANLKDNQFNEKVTEAELREKVAR